MHDIMTNNWSKNFDERRHRHLFTPRSRRRMDSSFWPHLTRFPGPT